MAEVPGRGATGRAVLPEGVLGRYGAVDGCTGRGVTVVVGRGPAGCAVDG